MMIQSVGLVFYLKLVTDRQTDRQTDKCQVKT